MDLDDLNVDNAYFRSFDILVRRQLDSVWHRVGPKTKQLVSDLATLRRLLVYVYAFLFHRDITLPSEINKNKMADTCYHTTHLRSMRI